MVRIADVLGVMLSSAKDPHSMLSKEHSGCGGQVGDRTLDEHVLLISKVTVRIHGVRAGDIAVSDAALVALKLPCQWVDPLLLLLLLHGRVVLEPNGFLGGFAPLEKPVLLPLLAKVLLVLLHEGLAVAGHSGIDAVRAKLLLALLNAKLLLVLLNEVKAVGVDAVRAAPNLPDGDHLFLVLVLTEPEVIIMLNLLLLVAGALERAVAANVFDRAVILILSRFLEVVLELVGIRH